MFERIKWFFRVYFILKQTLPGFSAHWSSSANKASNFGGFNAIGRRCRIFNSNIGKYTYISADTKIVSSVIGSFCSIGQEVMIGGLSSHPLDRLSTHPAFFSTKKQANISFVNIDEFKEQGPVEIGHDVWIGARAMILDNCKIGNGAVIAAGAVVVNDIPSYAIVGGVPARIIRYRFTPEQIKIIEEKNWWYLSINELRKIKFLDLKI